MANEQSNAPNLSRRQVLTAGTLTVAGALVLSAHSTAQPETEKGALPTKTVPVYVTDRELEEWTKTLLASFAQGIALANSLENAGHSTTNEYLQKFSQDAQDILPKGYLLSDLMECNRHIFTRDYVITVRYGEIYGELENALKKWLAERPKRD